MYQQVPGPLLAPVAISGEWYVPLDDRMDVDEEWEFSSHSSLSSVSDDDYDYMDVDDDVKMFHMTPPVSSHGPGNGMVVSSRIGIVTVQLLGTTIDTPSRYGSRWSKLPD
ncbi:hypothetical protein JB92DRAFT_3127143 [Gautieria morchelliformis]|nr:hypothetical protein JB92DRAFT_3127143 [Gautieria morchelliformis]